MTLEDLNQTINQALHIFSDEILPGAIPFLLALFTIILGLVLAQLTAFATPSQGLKAEVRSDGANNGVYSYLAGAWVKTGELPEVSVAVQSARRRTSAPCRCSG